MVSFLDYYFNNVYIQFNKLEEIVNFNIDNLNTIPYVLGGMAASTIGAFLYSQGAGMVVSSSVAMTLAIAAHRFCHVFKLGHSKNELTIHVQDLTPNAKFALSRDTNLINNLNSVLNGAEYLNLNEAFKGVIKKIDEQKRIVNYKKVIDSITSADSITDEWTHYYRDGESTFKKEIDGFTVSYMPKKHSYSSMFIFENGDYKDGAFFYLSDIDSELVVISLDHKWGFEYKYFKNTDICQLKKTLFEDPENLLNKFVEIVKNRQTQKP